MKKLNIGICHYKIGDTDGVSLEIEKRANLLSQMGHKVSRIAGVESPKVDYVIPELDFNLPEVVKIKENSFGPIVDYRNEQELMSAIDSVANKIYEKLLEISKIEKFDYLFVHNIFSHGRHISAAKSFYMFFKKTKTKIISYNHDFWSSYGNLYMTPHRAVKDFISTYVPPKDPGIEHVVINSIMKSKLKEEFDLESTVFPDTFDFQQSEWKRDDYNRDLERELGVKDSDLIILHATRIVERKAIEIAFQVVKSIYDNQELYWGRTLYNGKVFSKDSDIVFILPGYVEPASMGYFLKLKEYCQYKGVKVVYAGDICKASREILEGRKYYSLWDFYAISDIVTYTSTWEGWGNQFVEAIFARKPIVVFEYPVYKSDIGPEGYKVFSLGGECAVDERTGLKFVDPEIIEETVRGLLREIFSYQFNKVSLNNFAIGDRFHGKERLKELIFSLLK
ncbi:glycosyltransferase family 4 protein [Candidatus Dojkabacteria bacterium]|nr:glycosyltransferase family 4 protein [Candidatus Dojkabacteria bacterium]